MSDLDGHKRRAALAAARHIASGMVVGLGSGSTAKHVTLALGAALASGELERVRGVPTSLSTMRLAKDAGISLIELPVGGVDLAIDGMDELDPNLDAIKGLGGALLREKIVAASATSFVLIGDASKRVRQLGEKAPIPIEVSTFGWRRAAAQIEALGLDPVLRGSEEDPFVSDNGNPVLDGHVTTPFDPKTLADALAAVPGVLAHGLFIDLTDRAYIADGHEVEALERRG